MSVPFAWQDKRMLRRIRERCPEYHSALGVYHALTVIGSDQEKQTFTTTHKWIASISGFSETTVRRRLLDLEKVGAVAVTTPPLRAPCTYRLLPFVHGEQTSVHGERAFVHGEAKPVNTIRRTEERKGRDGHFRPLTTPDRIRLEKEHREVNSRLADLDGDLADFVARETQPEKVRERDRLRTRKAELERSLGYVA